MPAQSVRGLFSIHKLRSLAVQGPKIVYDNNAYTITAIYHDGILRLYAHRPIQPMVPGGSEEYYMTLVEGFDISGSPNSFRRGVTAFRNARKWVMKKRNEFIAAANARMQNMAPTAASDLPASSSCIVS